MDAALPRLLGESRTQSEPGEKIVKIFMRYQDDGPSGPCGQACSTTNNWDILYIFENNDSARKFTREVEEMKSRENARVSMSWTDDDQFDRKEVIYVE